MYFYKITEKIESKIFEICIPFGPEFPIKRLLSYSLTTKCHASRCDEDPVIHLCRLSWATYKWHLYNQPEVYATFMGYEGQFWCKILGLVAAKKDTSVSTCKVGDCIPCTSWSIYINQLSFIFIPTIKDKTTMSVSPKCHHSPGSSPGILLIPVAGYVAPAQPLNNKFWQLELERRFSQTSNPPN